jgi:sec-independent protein translocase protein TatB
MFPEDRFLEILIIGALALIVIGPKDLPVVLRKVGRFVGRMRGMAAEFRASFDELARQSELDELRKEVEALRHHSPPIQYSPPTPPQIEAPQPVMEPLATPSADPEVQPKSAGEPS